MAVSVLIHGKIERAPELRTTKNGNPFMTATIRVPVGTEYQFWAIAVFNENAREELSRLGDGDMIAAQGTPKFSVWQQEDKEPRVSFNLTVEKILSLR